MNLGDEAILQVMLTELRRSLPVEITVFSRNPQDTLARHRVERAVPVRELSRGEVTPEIAPLDLFFWVEVESSTMLRLPTTCARWLSRKSWACQ
jgi:hypothetical protein